MQPKDSRSIAVLLPCYNEESAIEQTVSSFRIAFPSAPIYVYDNNSTDRTVELAAKAGAIVRKERLRGKGCVVRRMFADIDADLYVLADGDATYDATSARDMVDCAIEGQFDMVVGCRQAQARSAYRSGHILGNKILTKALWVFFGHDFTDILSGYRVFSRRFVKSFPAFSSGFEIETEICVHALRMRMPVCEVTTRYFERPAGSHSKLSTYRDGLIIVSTIFDLARQERPLLLFGTIGFLLSLGSATLALPIWATYLESGLVPRFPTAILSASIMLLGFLFGFTGLILDTVVRGRRETLRMRYLAIDGPGADSVCNLSSPAAD